MNPNIRNTAMLLETAEEMVGEGELTSDHYKAMVIDIMELFPDDDFEEDSDDHRQLVALQNIVDNILAG